VLLANKPNLYRTHCTSHCLQVHSNPAQTDATAQSSLTEFSTPSFNWLQHGCFAEVHHNMTSAHHRQLATRQWVYLRLVYLRLGAAPRCTFNKCSRTTHHHHHHHHRHACIQSRYTWVFNVAFCEGATHSQLALVCDNYTGISHRVIKID